MGTHETCLSVKRITKPERSSGFPRSVRGFLERSSGFPRSVRGFLCGYLDTAWVCHHKVLILNMTDYRKIINQGPLNNYLQDYLQHYPVHIDYLQYYQNCNKILKTLSEPDNTIICNIVCNIIWNVVCSISGELAMARFDHFAMIYHVQT